jgi:hypothetical protein
MAIIYTPFRAKEVSIEKEGKYYATQIKWEPVQHFYVKILPGFSLEIKMSTTCTSAVYDGYITVEIDKKNFTPDIFILRKLVYGNRYFVADKYPSRDSACDEGSFIENITRSFYVQTQENDNQKLESLLHKMQ